MERRKSKTSSRPGYGHRRGRGTETDHFWLRISTSHVGVYAPVLCQHKRNVLEEHVAHDDGHAVVVPAPMYQQQPFQVVCVAEVEKAAPDGTFLSDLTEEFLLDPDNPAFADVTLECEGVELKSHRIILAARSSVFKRMLSQGGFREQQTGRIKIEEMEVSILRQMIRYVYTDLVEVDEANVPALYYAADRYDIKNLIKFCLDRMLLHVDATSAAECYRLAHLRGHRELRKKSAKVIQENFEEVRATSGWILLKADSHLLEDFLAESFSAAAKAAAPQSPTQPDPYYDDDDDDDDDDYYY